MSARAGRLRAAHARTRRGGKPTGDTVEATRLYADRLAEPGLDVERWEAFPGTGTLVAPLPGGVPVPRIALQGHLDSLPLGHEPPRVEDGGWLGR